MLDFVEWKEMLVRSMCGCYMRMDGEWKKGHANVVHARWISFHKKLGDDVQGSRLPPV